MESFDTLLRRHRARAGVSGNALARAIGTDASYLNRIERGERQAPAREAVERIADALRLTPEERDELFVSAGHLPDYLLRLGPLDPTLRLVADVLGDELIPDDQRAAFRQIVALVAQRWRPGAR